MAKILLYGEIGWEIDGKNTVEWLDEHKGESIELHLNSPGGSVFEAIAIRGAVLACPDLTIVVDSLAASAAAIISLCGKPLKMAEYSRLMIHSASSFASGNSREMEKELKMLQSIDEDLAGMIASKMGMDKGAVVAEYFDGKDHWLTCDECVGMGLAERYEPDRPKNATCVVYDCLNGKAKEHYKPINDKDMKIETFQALAAFKDCTTEEEIVKKAEEQAEGIDELKRQVEEKDSKIQELEAKVSQFEAEKAKAQEEADEAKISDAVKEGRLPEEQADAFRALMKSDRENTIRLIDALKAPAKPADVRDFMKGEGDIPKRSYFQEEMAKIADQK